MGKPKDQLKEKKRSGADVFSEGNKLTELETRARLKRELFRLKNVLPALTKRFEIENYVGTRSSRFLIIQGQTGSGKSTQLPQYIADHPSFKGKKVVCIQPRKIAAISLQQRVSFEYGGGIVGQESREVGYQVGGNKCGRDVKIEFVTEGIMLEKIMSGDPSYFSNVGCIIVDEAHERSILCDILLGSFKQEDPRWKDIFVIVTSATINLEEFSKFFDSAPTVNIPGKLFPIEILYQPLADHEVSDLSNIRKRVVETALDIHVKCGSASGDILCFLPGQDDVLNSKDDLDHKLKNLPGNNELLKAKVFTLYGKQEPEQQKQVFDDLGNLTRKIVFATDVAETSVTINGIGFVVDSAMRKVMIFDPKRNISSLRLTTISKSSAIQRAGRCGRTRAGTCYRLYSELDYENMNVSVDPEIFRKPLSLAILSLMEMNMNPKDFEWISAPSKGAMAAAEEELRFLGAIAEGKTTDLGKVISQCQQEPKLVRMIYRGCELGLGNCAILLASILSVAHMFFYFGMDEEIRKLSSKMRNEFAKEGGDIVSMFRAYEQYLEVLNGSHKNLEVNMTNMDSQDDNKQSKAIVNSTIQRKKSLKAASDWCLKNFVNRKAVGIISSTHHELLRLFRITEIWKKHDQARQPADREIQQIILSGYFLNTARKINVRRARFPNYFAVHSGVSGTLERQAAILHYKGQLSNLKVSNESPEWIVFEKILRLSSTTLFPISTPVYSEWLQLESAEFFNLCLDMEDTLPTEKVVEHCSQECLRQIFGKHFANIDSLEEELGCSLETDLDHGIIIAYCSNINKQRIQQQLKAKIEQVVTKLSIKTVEEDYLGATRLVIGSGLEVKEVLFANEFMSIMIRGLLNVTKQDLSDHFSQLRLSMCLDNIDLFYYQTEANSSKRGLNVVIVFSSKSAAKEALNLLTSSKFRGEYLDVVPLKGRGGAKGVYQQEVCKLNVSWALGKSEARAKVCFRTAKEANDFVDKVSITGFARVVMVHGVDGKGVSKSKTTKKQPPVAKFGKRAYKFVDTGVETEFDYIVTVASLRPEYDETEIRQRAKPSVIKWIKLFRKERTLVPSEEIEQWRQKYLTPFRPHINTSEITAAYFKHDRNCGRGIFSISVEGNIRLQKAAKLTCHSYTPFSQPIRVDVEYNHTTSVHVELYKFVKEEVDELKRFAQRKDCNVNINEPKHTRAKFVHIRFRCSNAGVIRQVQQKLENISTFSKFNHEKLNLLFTSYGKKKLNELKQFTFMHWNARTHALYIYGTQATQHETKEKLNVLLNLLRKIEVFDRHLFLCKRKVDLKKNLDMCKIERICTTVGIPHYYFSGNRVVVTCSSEQLQKIEGKFEQFHFLYRKEQSMITKWVKKPDCCICGGPPDDPFVRSSVCSHLYCSDCIEPMMTMQQPDHPVMCPGENCGVLLSMADIQKIAGRSAINKILEIAVSKYQEQNNEEIFFCPRQECGQLLWAGNKITGEYGGEFYFCDECCTNYCRLCSNKLQKPIRSHDFEACEDCQVGLSQDASFHIKFIREKIFNLNCPRCSVAYIDFDGCAAVTCDNCKTAFCGLCLEDCGKDAHSHVSNCSKNPQKGLVFVDAAKVSDIYKEMRTKKLNDYLMKIEDQIIKTEIFRAVRRDLIDLRIDEKNINFGNLYVNPKLPHHWKPMLDHQIMIKVEVHKATPEFRNVQQIIQKTLTNEIICLERIQNSSHYLAFQAFKTRMQDAGLLVEEKQLFHGTKEANIDIICHENFNPNALPIHGNSFGKGTYFARDASYSLTYCSSSSGCQGIKMFVCRVLVGQVTGVREGNENVPVEYKTTVNNATNPSIFVKQDRNTFYPEYFVELK